ncbi:hypothetical protein HYS31_05890 [Candidatus Woesearchaeota archaeon]|nr:hypothetical protein [Candidatus Woesearchaeota archaeon]
MPLVTSFSGIRGIYGQDLKDSTAIGFAYSYLSFLRKKTDKNNITLVIGMDTRPSSAKLCDAIMGALDCNFLDVGIATTPAVEFAVRHFEADGGIIVTASHNEPHWNGFKFLSQDGAVLNEKEMNSVIGSSYSLKNFHRMQDRKIMERHSDAVKKYHDFVFEIIGVKNIEMIRRSGLKIVLDPNGGTGATAKNILEQCGVEVIGVNMNYGDFNRKIEPSEDSLIYLKNIIEENKADFAAGFDCDADRVEILLKDGRMVTGNEVLALVAEYALSMSKNPRNETVVVNDATSNAVRDICIKFRSRYKEVEVGETNVVEAMKKLKSSVGGEGSSGGVVIWPSRCRDGILTLIILLSLIAKEEKRLGDLVDELPKYFNLKSKLEFEPKKHDKIKKYLKDYYSNKGFKITENGGIKGSLKVITGNNSFVWFRESKTESGIFRIISDSDKKEEAEKLLNEGIKVFKRVNE